MTIMMQAFQAAIDSYNRSHEEGFYLFQDIHGRWQLGREIDGIPVPF